MRFPVLQARSPWRACKLRSAISTPCLDINMEGEYQPETADVLLEAGVPFAFVTGYDYVLEPRHEGVPLLEKPFGAIQLRVLLEKLVGLGSPSGNRSRGISA
jgi:hypothetical protein